MNIDKKLNLDTPIEMMESGMLCHAMNVKLSQDGTTIQNDNALKELLNTNSDIAGYIITDKDIVLFDKTNNIKVYNIEKNTVTKILSNNWKWCGGEVFGTYTYNGKQELILAVSERNAGTDVPLKIININDTSTDDNINKIYPNVPICNSVLSEIIDGGQLKIGIYTFYIRFKNDNYTTNWFAISKPLLLFNTDILKTKNKVISHKVQSYNVNGSSGYVDEETFNVTDKYATNEFINKCFKLVLNFNAINNYNKLELACIHNYNSSSKGYIINEYDLKINTTIIVDKFKEIYSIDDLLINTINVFNINTLCNYKNRLYIADYKEDDKNIFIKNIDTSSIKVQYLTEEIDLNDNEIYNKLVTNDRIIAPCTCFQFYLHYVFADGTYTDGLLIKANPNVIDTDVNFLYNDEENRLHAYKNINNEDVFYTNVNYINHLYFDNIPTLENAIGYFISYAEVENIFIGESVIVLDDKASEENTYKIYYEEFNVIGGQINPSKIISFNNLISQSVEMPNAEDLETDRYSNTTYNTSPIITNILSTAIVPPDSNENIGREGYLKIITETPLNNTTLYSNSYILINDKNIKSLYINKNKTLISFGNINVFNVDKSNNNYTANQNDNLPHYWTYNSIYRFKGPIIISDNDSNPTNAETGKYYYGRFIKESYIFKLTYPCVSIYPLFNKVINIAPERIIYSYKNYNYNEFTQQWELINTYEINNFIVKPSYINSLFKLDASYYNYFKKIYQNYDEDKIALTSKTIRRSDIISDESLELGWKNFRVENYKIITENKGNIKNIVSVGTYLLVHCEASLFAFDVNNVMQTTDKNVQLTMPDVFDVNYKEVFTAEQGYGGLQDNTSWIFNQFGYIFLDNNAKTIYKFDNGNLNILNKGVNSLLKNNIEQYKYNSVKIGYDKIRDRFLFTFVENDNKFTISYNIQIDDWVSIHSYNDIKYYISSKDELFILNKENKLLNYNNNEFNKYNSIETYFYNDNDSSYIDVVFLADKNYIKVLNYITYIINKLPNDIFEKLTLQIYNDVCITDEIDISSERKNILEYKKPFFDFGKWNFNYFRNIAKNIYNEEIVNRLTGQINNIETSTKKGLDNALVTGKYFVIRFKFKNTTKEINIKDIHAYYQ